MFEDTNRDETRYEPEVLSHAPEELTRAKLRRLGEGIGKVVYASEHWVVKRERSNSEILALIVIWKVIRKVEHILPSRIGENLLRHPSRQLRLLRVMIQGVLSVIPRSLWFMTHIGEVWHVYRTREQHGETLAQQHLSGTSLVPARISFPPTRVRVGGWPGWLVVDEATERVEATLHQKLSELARAGRVNEIELWLDRFLRLRQAGWKRGLFAIDAHFKNFGVTEDRVVLLDSGGLTNHWQEIETRLKFEDKAPPHVRLGLGPILAAYPDIAERFDAHWKSAVNLAQVKHHWPVDPAA